MDHKITTIICVLFQILDLIGFICVMCSGAVWRATSTGEFYSFVAMTGFWTTGTLLLFYLLHVMEKFHVIPWMLIEFVFCALWSFFYLATSIDMSVNASYVSAFGAAAFFGFVACAVYGYDAFLKFQGWRAGQLAQGERTVQKSTSEVASPSY